MERSPYTRPNSKDELTQLRRATPTNTESDRQNLAKAALAQMRGQVRLEELRDRYTNLYDGHTFDQDIMQLVENGEIELRPIGNVVSVQTVGCRTKHYPPDD